MCALWYSIFDGIDVTTMCTAVNPRCVHQGTFNAKTLMRYAMIYVMHCRLHEYHGTPHRMLHVLSQGHITLYPMIIRRTNANSMTS